MRATLATIPDATGGLHGVLTNCVTLSRVHIDDEGRPLGASIGYADTEIEAAIREVHEQLEDLGG
jgi:hypothetical protein